MPTGTPDFSQNLSYDQTAQAIDLGEVANRINRGMGSMSRSGSWLFGDDFANWAAGQYNPIGTGTLAVTTAKVVRPGARQSLTMTTGAVNGNTAGIQRVVQVYPTRMGLEVMYFIPAFGANAFTFDVYMLWSRSSSLYSNGYTASIRIQNTGTKYVLWVFEDNGGVGAFVNRVDPLPILSGVTVPHYIKVVADFQTGTYGNVYIDYIKYDFSTLNMGKQAATGPSTGLSMELDVMLTTNAALARAANIGDLIFTKDEP